MNQRRDPRGRNVVITGGSRGIGAAAVELFAAKGDRVTFLYEKNHAAANAVAEKTGARAICCDVADSAAVKEAFASINDVDILICNAGVCWTGLLSAMPEEDWNRIFDVNVKGVYNCVNAAMPAFLSEAKKPLFDIMVATTVLPLSTPRDLRRCAKI